MCQNPPAIISPDPQQIVSGFTYSWVNTDNNVLLEFPDNGQPSYSIINDGAPVTLQMRFTRQNPCGSETRTATSVAFNNSFSTACGGGGQRQFRVSPNPASDVITLEQLPQQPSLASAAAPIEVDAVTAEGEPVKLELPQGAVSDVRPRRYEIYGAGGRLVRKGLLSGTIESISVSALNTGSYKLVVYSGDTPIWNTTIFKR